MRFLTAVLLVASLTACKDNPIVPPGPAGITGTYTLTQIKGEPLPWVFARHLDGTPSEEYTGGTLVLREDMTFTETRNLRQRNSSGVVVGTVVQTLAGTYTKNDEGAVRLTVTNLGVAFGYDCQVEGKTLTLMLDVASPWVYVRP